MRNSLLIVIVILMLGCSNSSQNSNASSAKPGQDKVVITNDMENAKAMIPSWNNEISVVKMDNGKAHSGEYVSKVDEITLYSYAYGEIFKNISDKLPKKVEVNGWIYSPDPSKNLGIVMDISENNKTQIWKAFSINDLIKAPDKWFEFTAYFSIDQPIKPNYKIKIYGYGGKKIAYFDDFKITFEY